MTTTVLTTPFAFIVYSVALVVAAAVFAVLPLPPRLKGAVVGGALFLVGLLVLVFALIGAILVGLEGEGILIFGALCVLGFGAEWVGGRKFLAAVRPQPPPAA